MITKTKAKVMGLFVSEINKRFSIKEISDLIKKPYPQIHKIIKQMVRDKLISKEDRTLFLNYKSNYALLSYIESLRKENFLKTNKTIALFIKDVLERVKIDFFIFLIFGSSTKKQKPRDIDILFVVEEKDRISEIEKILDNIASNFSLEFDINVISVDSAYEMFLKRDEANIMNETLNNHIIIFGAENYYRILKNVR